MLDARQKQDYENVINGSASYTLYSNALKNLSKYLHVYHKQRVIILIDEYDAVAHEAYLHSFPLKKKDGQTEPTFYENAMNFMQLFLGEGLKGNKALKFGVITGILRIARESIFSGLNNLRVCTLLNAPYNTAFGFSEQEVQQLLEHYGYAEQIANVRTWYDGYMFKKAAGLYNPWSILSFVDNEGELRPYWVKTAQENIIKKLVEPGSSEQRADLAILMSGEIITKNIDENIIFEDLETNPDVFWALLLFSGYLTFTSVSYGRTEALSGLKFPTIR